MINDAINPLDGRYYERTRALVPYFSESALMKYRTMMECEFILLLSESGFVDMKKFNPAQIKSIRRIYEDWNDIKYKKIKSFEATTNHDVKSVEYFVKDELKKLRLDNSIEWVHFGLTSEDTNNIAYALMISDSLSQIIIPKVESIANELNVLAKKYAKLPMLSRTHGQSASPTTFGKEMKVFSARLEKQIKDLKSIKIDAKLNGATGNYNAFVVAYPKVNWPALSKKYIENFNQNRKQKLNANLITTQIECHDSYVATFDNIRRINMILLDFAQDMWRYVSDGYVVQKPKAGEVGSSTMPHKVNPIDFENAEGNIGIANALFTHFSLKLPVSRLQRDLSDSTVERTIGTAFGHSLLAYIMLEKGLSKISVNENKIKEDLNNHPEVVAEAIQTVMRREGLPIPYEALKEITRGKEVTMEDFAKFIDTLKVSPKIKTELKKITPENYTGIASKLAL